jgi:hypothetical protein
MRHRTIVLRCLGAAAAALLLLPTAPPSRGSAPGQPPVLGRWDLTVHGSSGDYPSWLEVTEKDGQLVGRFVGRVGSVRAVKSVSFTDGTLAWS